MSGAEAVRAQVAEAVDRLADDLERLSHRIHESPELAAALMQFELDQQIPPALYVAIAEVLAWAYRLEAGAS